MAEKQPQRLEVDLDQLFPGKTLKIGSQTLYIQPLGAGKLVILIKKFKTVVKSLEEDGVTWDNFQSPENMFKLITKVMEDFPELLAEASNIHVDDLKSLPIELNLQILDKVIEVNMESKDSLLGNFNSLMGKFVTKIEKKTPKKVTKA
jgi:hypothetical protein